jgi:2-keto-4-pentenoate hydratase
MCEQLAKESIMKTNFKAMCAVLLLAGASQAQAGCPSKEEVFGYVKAYATRQSVAPIAHIKSVTEAYCAQGMVAATIGRKMGIPAGFKAAYTGRAVQEHSGIRTPIRAYLFEHMFLEDGVTVEANFGARPQFSADLIAVVKDEHLQSARTPLEALQHISHFVPFIELSDAMLHEDVPPSALALIATNVGVRYGVLGAPIEVEASEEFLQRLAQMRVVMTDAEGNALGEAAGEATDHSLNAVLWLGQDLSYNATRIFAGDRLSVGAFFPPLAPKAGQSIKVQYFGLPGDPSVSVRFSAPQVASQE